MKTKRAKKPTYYQMCDWLSVKFGYEYMLALRRDDPHEQAAAVRQAFLQACEEEARQEQQEREG